jgi:Alpha/beta hydrolase family
MSKPTIVLVPGAWHSPESYSDVVAILSKHGYPTVSLPLPSVGAIPPHKDMTGDVEGIKSCLEKLVSEEKEVVLVTHSFSSVPGQQAPVGLNKKEQIAKGLKGGVIRFVVINGVIVPAGYEFVAKDDYSRFPQWMNIDVEVSHLQDYILPTLRSHIPQIDIFQKNLVTVSPEDAKNVFYNDLSSEKGDELAAKLKHQSLGVYFSTPTYAAWQDIPSTFLQGDLDQSAVNDEMIQAMIGGARQIEPSAFDVIEHCVDAGHCLMISRPVDCRCVEESRWRELLTI